MNEVTREVYMTIDEVAGYLKLSKPTIRRYVLNRNIPFRKIMKSIRFRLSEIEVWVESIRRKYKPEKADATAPQE
jgi:excisionase family DNA binding protein